MSTTPEVGAAASARVSSAVSAAYAGGAYLAFLVVLLYAVFFQAGVLVPRTVDGGGPAAGTSSAVVIDVLLLGLFAVQHSVMARPAFKHRLTKIVPKHVERSTYVLATTGVLALVFWQWRPIPTVLWRVDDQAAQAGLWALFAAGLDARCRDDVRDRPLRHVRATSGRPTPAWAGRERAGVSPSVASPAGSPSDDAGLLPSVPRRANHDRQPPAVRDPGLRLHPRRRPARRTRPRGGAPAVPRLRSGHAPVRPSTNRAASARW